MIKHGFAPDIEHAAALKRRLQRVRAKRAERHRQKTKCRGHADERDPVHLPPKNFRNDWNSRFGSVVAFWPRSWSFWANCVWVPPWISHAAVGTLSSGNVIS